MKLNGNKYDKLEIIADRIKAMSHPHRITIIALFGKQDTLTISDIQNRISLRQSKIVHHLNILKSQQIIIVNKEGRKNLYHLKWSSLNEIVDYLNGDDNKSSSRMVYNEAVNWN